MKKRFFYVLLSSVLFVSGCACHPITCGTFSGNSVNDLESAKASGTETTVNVPYNIAFDKVTAKIKDQGLTIFKSSPEKGFIIAINFPRQTNTTRVGFFFEKDGENKTRITLSSLSTSARIKAEKMVLQGLFN